MMTLHALTVETLNPFRHGFFTRHGGASSGVFQGLNCGRGSSDLAEIVRINRARVAAHLEIEPANLITLDQVHSADVVTISAAGDDSSLRADGMVTATRGLGLGILTADCQPVLFAEAGSGLIGAAHAGWRGALAGVLEATVDAMVKLGAVRERIVAVIGPTISQQNYEVGPEFFDTFLDEDPAYARFFTAREDDRMQFDLPDFGLFRLRRAGIGHAEWTRHCTYEDAEMFYSYRRRGHREEADYGRQISVIRL